jgi:hypothetical protein
MPCGIYRRPEFQCELHERGHSWSSGMGGISGLSVTLCYQLLTFGTKGLRLYMVEMQHYKILQHYHPKVPHTLSFFRDFFPHNLFFGKQ